MSRIYIVIVIPALNADQKLLRLAEEIAALFSPRLVVVNDGSDEKNAHIFESLKRMGCDVLMHTRNLGKGAALKTGIRHALTVYPDALGIVTADADGQHSPQDIFYLAQRILESPEGIILGTRYFDETHVPFKSRWGNKITSAVFWLRTGLRLADTQTGLRAIPMRYAPAIALVNGSRFEFEMNMLLLACRMEIPLIAAPIHTIYSGNNSSSHFRAVRDSARIYFDILKFGCSSLICAALDFGLFVLLSAFVFSHAKFGIAISTILARIVSGLCNFLFNRFIVFGEKRKGALMKYLFLFLAQMFLSAQLTTLLAVELLNAPIAKLVADAALFLLSFILQRKFIFRREAENHAKKSQ
ncbi:MAG: bifunctional glycosyltransferase family 2/GtrA family protein [Clostridiales bacterium]|nr:bifunctional glycosyltransferase family 2/GtrA family protein [Clostridiales bacterium]